MKFLTREHHIFAMSPDTPPALYVKEGELFQIQTSDCFCNQLQNDGPCPHEVLSGPCNPATGPVYVEGALPGDTLKIHILKIEVAAAGVTEIDPLFGALSHATDTSLTKILPVREGSVIFNENLRLDLQPMIGVIGVSPKSGSIPTDTPDIHGGNLDCRQITEGACLYLPVQVPGALLALGDLHACMGDGEIGGCGAEIPGRVTLQVSILHQRQKPYPMVETNETLLVLSSRKTVEDAWQAAAESLHAFLTEETNLTSQEAVMLLSLAGNLCLCQVVNPNKTAGMWISKKYLTGCTFLCP